MIRKFYVTTKDPRGKTHSYKLSASEQAPIGHDIVDLKPAGIWPVSSLIDEDTLKALYIAFPTAKKVKRA